MFKILFLFLISNVVYATSLSFNEVPIADAIRAVAKVADRSIILSKDIKGKVTFITEQANPDTALRFLLKTQGLSYWDNDGIWFIAPRTEILHRQHEEDISSMHWQLHYARVDDITKTLQPLLSNKGAIQGDQRTNVLFIEDSPSMLKRINSVLRRLDIPTPQIQITVRLASIDIDFEKELGINLSNRLLPRDSERADIKKEEENTTGQYNIALVKLADHSLLDVKLSALENAGRATLISSPRLFTTNLQPASIEAGEEVPYQAVSLSGGTAVDFKKAVLGLKVTPQVLPNARMLLTIQVNQDRPSNKLVQGMPTISTRQLASTILAKSGETIVLGGIYEVNHELAERGVPILKEIPIVGWLFKQRNKRLTKRELLIFVTPTQL